MSDTQSTAPSGVQQSAGAETQVEASSLPVVEQVVADQKPAQDERLSNRFAVLSKKEKRVLQKSEAAKVREQAAIAKEQDIAKREAQIQAFEELLKQDPMKALESRGLTYQQLTDLALNDNRLTPEFQITQLKKEMEAAKKAQEDSVQKEQERQQAAQQAEEERVTAHFKNEIKDFVQTNQSKYELTKLYGQETLVYDTVAEHYEQTGKVLSITEASDLVEAYLERELDKVLETKKFKAKVTQSTPEKTDFKQYIQQSKTLTNQASNSASNKPEKLSDAERIKRAIAVARGI